MERKVETPREGKRPLRMGDGGEPKPTLQFGQVRSFLLAPIDSTTA